MRRSRILLIAIAVCGLVVISGGHKVSAAKPATPVKGGITLSPFEQQISLAPDDTTKTFNLLLTNNTNNLQELSISARDFGSLNDTGGVLLEGSKSYTQKYGLTSWLVLGTDTVVLQPGEKRNIPITIENRSSLQPGGHYGAVVVSVTGLNNQKSNQVLINQQLLSLLFVKKIGGEHYDLKLKEVEQNGNWFNLPTTVKLRFQNPGNVHVAPRGLVKLKAPSGKVLAQGIINAESAYILPETFRELYVPLIKVNSSLPLPGAYKVEVDYRYDGLDVVAHKSYLVRYVNLWLGVLVLLIAVTTASIVKGRKKNKKNAAQKPTVTE